MDCKHLRYETYPLYYIQLHKSFELFLYYVTAYTKLGEGRFINLKPNECFWIQMFKYLFIHLYY